MVIMHGFRDYTIVLLKMFAIMNLIYSILGNKPDEKFVLLLLLVSQSKQHRSVSVLNEGKG